MKLNANVGIAGLKRFVVKKTNGLVRLDTGWTKNLITDTGLDEFCLSSSNLWTDGYCEVGSGNSTPSNSDTSLQTSVAQTNSKISGASQTGWDSGGDYVYKINGWVFSEGAFSGDNLSEVGFKVSSGSNLCSRSLIVDSEGSPTTITVQSDETLHVYYEFRIYYPTSDINTSITDSTTSVNHTMVIKPSRVNLAVWGADRGLGYTTSQTCNTYNGSLGGVTSSPSGQSGLDTSDYEKNTYTSGDFSRKQKYTFGLSRGNASGGVSAIRFAVGKTNWQASFDPAVAKDATKKWDVEFEVSVSRAAI